ncbi:LysR family transcriptional regulator [Oceanisphaera sp. KMM 10153]|uniref:LysR family transcriptional regulator n=1 Tax=Oceanisphaera submarina TaxID=3390193 RepID=UPI003976E79A
MMNKLANMALFAAIVEHNGMAAAAKHLNTSPASVSTKLKALENHYGVKLLNRTTRTVRLTDEGEQFYQLSKATLKNIAEMENQMMSQQDVLRGNLRISAPRDLGKNVIAPMLDLFLDRHPELVPHLILSDDILPIHDSRLDVVFRYGHLDDSQLVSRRLRISRRVLCASPGYLERHGKPTVPEDLHQHQCLGLIRAGEQLTRWTFSTGQDKQHLTIQPGRLSNDGEVIKRWAIDGHGIALKSWVDVEKDAESGRLVVILQDYLQDFVLGVTDGADLSLIYPARLYLPARTRAFIDFSLDYFARY